MTYDIVPYIWDFTFDLGKSPLYYVLALNYQNITLIDKTTGKSLVMLGPVLVCYKKDRKAFKLLRNTLLDVALSLAEKLKALGSDGENTISTKLVMHFFFQSCCCVLDI